jgi:hypothetical protein
MRIKVNDFYDAYFFIMLFFLLTLLGCGSGGSGGGGGDVSNGNASIESGDSGSTGPGPGSSTDNSVTLAWDRPDSNSDGSDLNDLAGYKIYYGTSSNNYTQFIDVGNITSAVISNLSAGTWCFATTAYDTAGNESDYSIEACKAI